MAYFIWFFSSLIFWISCLWYTGNLSSPFLFFVFLLPFFNTILKGVKHFYLTLFPFVVIILLSLFFKDPSHSDLLEGVLSANSGWVITYRLFSFLGLCLVLIDFKKIQKETISFYSDPKVMMSFNASKMATLSEMAGGVSHEINNPLTIIVGQIYTLKKIPKKNEVTEAVAATLVDISDKIKENSNRITKIIKDLRNFAKDASHDPFEVAELKPIILNSFELYSEKLKNYSFEVEFHCDEDFYVSTRKVELQQAFSNLVVNSFDFGKGKEKSWIKVIISKVKTGHIQVLFSDSGGGISPSIQDKIFEPFFSTELPKKTGLGLSIAQSIFQIHGGSISLIDGPITCFEVLLPFHEKKEEGP